VLFAAAQVREDLRTIRSLIADAYASSLGSDCHVQ
jgi:hypothetical protein